jgi:hypothetical protein
MNNFKKIENFEECKRMIDRRLSKPRKETKTLQEWCLDGAAIQALERIMQRDLDLYYALRGDEYLSRLMSEHDHFVLAAA